MTGVMVNLLYVGAGSCIGGMARYLVGRLLPITSSGFPWGTLIVNLLGCFILGVIFGFLNKNVCLSDGIKLFLTVGFCGGFTTYSTFMYENFCLIADGRLLQLLVYMSLSIIVGLILTIVGYSLGNSFH